MPAVIPGSAHATPGVESNGGASMRLSCGDEYRARGLTSEAIDSLAQFGDMLRDSVVNVTAVKEAEEIEEKHFLDSLSFLEVEIVRTAPLLLDVGSGGGLPAVVLALASPHSRVVALESNGKKCAFIGSVRDRLGLANLEVVCSRAEDFARGPSRGSFDVVVSRAVAALPVLAELCVPLVAMGGSFVAAKGSMSDEESMEGRGALAILGCGSFREIRVEPFVGALHRRFVIAEKTAPTPERYPRRPGIPEKRPLGRSR